MNYENNHVNFLLCGLKDGDQSKQKELYDSTYDQLKIIALTYAKDKNDWEDILTEAYYKAFKYISSFDCSKNGFNWLCKIVQNVAYNYNAKADFCISLDAVIERNVFTSLENMIVDENALLNEIEQLDEADRQLIYIKFWENKTYRETAKILNSKKSTVHKRTMQLIDILKEKLMNTDDDCMALFE